MQFSHSEHLFFKIHFKFSLRNIRNHLLNGNKWFFFSLQFSTYSSKPSSNVSMRGIREWIMCMQMGIPGSSDGKESACNAGDPDLIPGSRRSPAVGSGNPLQYSCLENSMNRGACWLQSRWSERVRHNWETNTCFTLLFSEDSFHRSTYLYLDTRVICCVSFSFLNILCKTRDAIRVRCKNHFLK